MRSRSTMIRWWCPARPLVLQWYVHLKRYYVRHILAGAWCQTNAAFDYTLKNLSIRANSRYPGFSEWSVHCISSDMFLILPFACIRHLWCCLARLARTWSWWGIVHQRVCRTHQVWQYVINSTENFLVLTLTPCVSQMSLELAIVQDALEVSLILLISFEHLEVTLLIFRIISGVCVSLLLPVVFPIRFNLLFFISHRSYFSFVWFEELLDWQG